LRKCANGLKNLGLPREIRKKFLAIVRVDWIVIGRPITAAENPKEASAKVVAELS